MEFFDNYGSKNYKFSSLLRYAEEPRFRTLLTYLCFFENVNETMLGKQKKTLSGELKTFIHSGDGE